MKNAKAPGALHVSNLPAPGKKWSSDVQEVKKLPQFKGMYHKLVQRDLNPRLPKFRVLKTHEFPPVERIRKHCVLQKQVFHIWALSVSITALV